MINPNSKFLFLTQDAAFLNAAVREREDEWSRRTLQALVDMRIKFPGKTDEEAESILESVSKCGWLNYRSTVITGQTTSCVASYSSLL